MARVISRAQGTTTPKLSDDERELAQMLGRRVAELAVAARRVRHE